MAAAEPSSNIAPRARTASIRASAFGTHIGLGADSRARSPGDRGDQCQRSPNVRRAAVSSGAWRVGSAPRDFCVRVVRSSPPRRCARSQGTTSNAAGTRSNPNLAPSGKRAAPDTSLRVTRASVGDCWHATVVRVDPLLGHQIVPGSVPLLVHFGTGRRLRQGSSYCLRLSRKSVSSGAVKTMPVMGLRFIPCDRDQSFLMPPDLREWLPENHLAWFVLAAVEEMDLYPFYAAHRVDGKSRSAYEPAMMGWIQPVVATLDDEELRCRGETLRWFVPQLQGRVARGVRRLGAGNTGSGSGKRSPEGHRLLTRLPRRVSCGALVSAGSGRLAGCRLSPSRRCRGVICHLRSGRRSRSCSLVIVGCERSRVSWVARRRLFPGNCNATLRSAPVGRSIGPPPRRRMPTVAPGGQSRRSWRSTRNCVAMCRTALPGLCSGPRGALRVRRSAGGGGVMDRGRTGAGGRHGVRSRSPVGFALTSPMMSRCGSLTKRSISRSMCRAAERCAES